MPVVYYDPFGTGEVPYNTPANDWVTPGQEVDQYGHPRPGETWPEDPSMVDISDQINYDYNMVEGPAQYHPTDADLEAHYGAAMDEARDMWETGKTVAEIAVALGVTVAEVIDMVRNAPPPGDGLPGQPGNQNPTAPTNPQATPPPGTQGPATDPLAPSTPVQPPGLPPPGTIDPPGRPTKRASQTHALRIR